ncbi:coenzyme F390 synthetase [Microbacterium testaceum StLB037]|uniref:Coenzyme F390 synthetase n=1 Tax=Microbacterium testaceum (strain StLB037) TaxID=979556 RepID=E8NDD4_MICTS|nr:hypothetical protein [Microbacterium testaceum]BAJ74992.1 coenzyme F390 synthetase [Microbacterium testaceum StLB037]
MSLDAYLNGHSPERRELFAELVTMAAGLADHAEDVSPLVFVPGRPHPEWEDADEVLWMAVEQLMLPNPAAPDELPVLWVGYHVQDRLTRKREAQGFLLTSHRLVAKDTVDLVFTKGTERQYPLYEARTASLASTATEEYDWDGTAALLGDARPDAIEQLLAEAIASTVHILESRGETLPVEPAPTTNLRERVAELDLAGIVKYEDDAKHAKHFAKLFRKVSLDPGERVLASFSDATLFGPYGLVLTDRNLRSRDLGEDAISTPRADIDPSAVRVSPDKAHQLAVGPGRPHDVPTFLDEKQVGALVTLVREWAAGRID